jgi:hypothetical protein
MCHYYDDGSSFCCIGVFVKVSVPYRVLEDLSQLKQIMPSSSQVNITPGVVEFSDAIKVIMANRAQSFGLGLWYCQFFI